MPKFEADESDSPYAEGVEQGSLLSGQILIVGVYKKNKINKNLLYSLFISS